MKWEPDADAYSIVYYNWCALQKCLPLESGPALLLHASQRRKEQLHLSLVIFF